MNYEVAYLSKFDMSEILAQEIGAMLPVGNTTITDLSSGEVFAAADINFIGFDFDGGALPLKIMDVLDRVQGKTVALFAACGMMPTAADKDSAARKVLPFLPDECDYKGLFLCAGQLPEHILRSIKEKMQAQPAGTEAEAAFARYLDAMGHPDSRDMDALRQFVKSVVLW